MKISCEIIRDILPLYAEDMVSQPTRELVEDHLAECECCSSELAAVKNNAMPVESGTTSLMRVKYGIRRRRMLSVLAVFFFIVTLLTGGALLMDATVYMSAEEAVKEIWIEGNTVKIRWDNRITATASQCDTEDPGNYAVTAWTNLQNILVPPHRVPYEALDEEVKAFITEEQYASMANTSTFELSREDGTNFWYYDMSSGDVVMILDGGQPQPEQELMSDTTHIRGYVYGLSILCILSMAVGICFHRRWYGQLAIRVGILAGSCALSGVIVTAGQLVDIYGRFTEMIVDSTIVVVPMVLCAFCVLRLIQLNRQDKGL